jgi:type I restriction enzyme S subunit
MTFWKENEFQDSPIGKIPKDWETVKLGELLDLRNGQRPKVSEKGRFPIFGANGIMGYTNEFLADNDFTIILGRVGASGEIHLGKEKIWVSDNAIFSEEYNKGRVYPPYLFYLLKSKKLSQFASKTTHPIITKTFLDSFSVQLPKRLEEQRGVVGVLGVVDSAIGLVDRVVWKTERSKKGLMQELLTKGIGHKEFKDTEIGRIPKDWQVARIEDITLEHKQGFYTNEPYTQTGIKLVRVTDLLNPKLSYETMPLVDLDSKTIEQFGVSVGDFLIARSGAIGRYGIVTENLPCVFGSYIIRFRFNHSVIDSAFFGYLYESNHVAGQLLRLKHGATNININAANIKSMKIPLPPFPEQQRITEVLSSIDEKLELERKEKAKLERIKQSLMDWLLTGKVRVKVD